MKDVKSSDIIYLKARLTPYSLHDLHDRINNGNPNMPTNHNSSSNPNCCIRTNHNPNHQTNPNNRNTIIVIELVSEIGGIRVLGMLSLL
jgi:hypothetical protein